MTGLTRREALRSAGAVTSLAVGGSAAATISSGLDDSDEKHRDRHRDSPFLATWAASPQAPYSGGISSVGFENETLRLVTRTSVGGKGVRIRLANTFGDDPVTFDRASIGIRDEGAAVQSKTLRQVTFGGDTAVSIPPGARAISDPVDLRVEAEQDLAISLYAASATGQPTWHALPTKTSYVSKNDDYAFEASGEPFADEVTHWFFLEGVEVVAPEMTGAIACVGNSITDGFNSTIDANAAYPDVLAERVNEHEDLRKSVINAGISGNRVLNDSACCGVNALARLDRDVLTQTGVTDVILLEGINDIGFQQLEGPATAPQKSVTAEEIIDGYQQLIRRAHAQGVRVYGGTLTPFKGADYYYEAGEHKRQKANRFIRRSRAFDGVIDFDKAIRDPDDPKRILPKYDSGDKLHPNDAGYRAMAEAVDLSLFRGRERASQPDAAPDTAGGLLSSL